MKSITIILLATLASACAKKTSTFSRVVTRDSTATVTLPARSTSIISDPCDSMGLRPFEITQVVGRDTLKLIGYRDRIVTEYITPGDTSTKLSLTDKSESVKTIPKTVTPKWAWLSFGINCGVLLGMLLYFLIRKNRR